MITQITMDALRIYMQKISRQTLALAASYIHAHTHIHTRVLLPHYSVPLLSRPQNGNLSVSTRLGSESTGFSLLTDWLGLESDVYL